MRVIDADEVKKSLNFSTLIPGLKAAFSSDFGMPQRSLYHLPTDEGQDDSFAVLPAWNNEVMGVKAFTHLPANPSKGLETLSSKLMLFSRQTGAPLALVDGTELTFWRTAAVSALAADYLAKPDANTLLLYGTGKLAPFMAVAHAEVRPIKTIYVTGRSAEKIAETVETIQQMRPDIEVKAVSDADSVIGSADIISCATGSPEPLFSFNQVHKGAHIDLVGNHSRDRRECDSESVINSSVYIDSRLNVLNEAGEILIPISEGKFDQEQVKGELAELCSGEVSGRQNNDEVTLFKSVGTALSDLAAAYLVYQAVS